MLLQVRQGPPGAGLGKAAVLHGGPNSPAAASWGGLLRREASLAVGTHLVERQANSMAVSLFCRLGAGRMALPGMRSRLSLACHAG